MEKKCLLDSSFIISCVNKKIDFFTFLRDEGFSGSNILIPKQVIIELEKISLPISIYGRIAKEKETAALSLRIILNNVFDKVDLNVSLIPSLKRRTVDNLIIDYANAHPDIYIASLDKGILKKVKNKKLLIHGRKELGYH